jgi:hypothetical protein
MKRLFAVFALCATALIAASAVSNPAAADGRHDGRRHAGQSDRQTNWNTADRGAQRRAVRAHRERRHHKFRRRHERQRYTHRPAYGYGHRHAYGYGHRHAYGYRHRHGYAYGPPRHRYGYRTGATYALQLDGAGFIFRID